MCVLVKNKSDIEAFKNYVTSGVSVKKDETKNEAPKKLETPVVPPKNELVQAKSVESIPAQTFNSSDHQQRLFATPLAKKIASEKHIDLSVIRRLL